MARRGRSAGPEISLFPFLSILACLIGALTILIVALSVAEIMQGRKDESVARAEDYLALQRKLSEREAEIVQRQAELRKTDAAAVAFAELRPQVEKVRGELKKLEPLADEKTPLERQIVALKEERKVVIDERKKVEAGLVEGKEKLGEMAKQLGRGLPLRILSTSDYFRKVAPVFVEARKEAIVIHSPSQVVTVPRGQIKAHAKYKQAVDYVAAKEDRVIVFLVRDDGRSSFYAAQDHARANGAVTSKVPLQGSGEIDLKEFFKRR